MKRKLQKNNRGSYYLNIPKEMIKDLKWKDKQNLEVEVKRSGLVVKDWEEK